MTSHRTQKTGYTLIRYNLSGVAMNVSIVSSIRHDPYGRANKFWL